MIRPTTPDDLKDILDIQRRAFNEEDEAELVANLLDDKTAQPVLSLIACDNEDTPIGHILFTKAYVDNLSAYLLAPLAVVPEVHYKGTGQRLMKEGLKILKSWGVDVVFVLGPPDYYPRAGFLNDAGAIGYPAPHTIPAKHADAWMMQHLSDKRIKGTVRVADAIAAEEYWKE
ncbi:N-acetyltransferase [Terasakiella sp. A23]|uniref:GNAT family N-acetyltransferase n=1 Tax=Terasakiella sp. FCG-A23 TaxID=3080561 RepID=UPI002953BCEF|nr:N-acetyltransferase [Terasakiella sp. A23]MDV7339707.1 N-acetyltransferase [Terasakiella sp. A23]